MNFPPTLWQMIGRGAKQVDNIMYENEMHQNIFKIPKKNPHLSPVVGTSAPTLTSPVTGLTSQPAVSQQPGQQPGTAAATATTAGAVGPTLTTQVVHKCPKCGYLAPSKNQLTQHRKKFHGKQAQVQAAQTAYTTTGKIFIHTELDKMLSNSAEQILYYFLPKYLTQP